MKKLMCAEFVVVGSDSYRLAHEIACEFSVPSYLSFVEGGDWQDEARLEAQYENKIYNDSDFHDVRSYLEYKIRTSIFFENCVVLNETKIIGKVPDGLVIVGHRDGQPLLAFWEEDWH